MPIFRTEEGDVILCRVRDFGDGPKFRVGTTQEHHTKTRSVNVELGDEVLTFYHYYCRGCGTPRTPVHDTFTLVIRTVKDRFRGRLRRYKS